MKMASPRPIYVYDDRLGSYQPQTSSKILSTHEFCLFLKGLESEGKCAAAQAIRFFLFTDVKMIRLPYMMWSGVDILGKVVTIARPPLKSGRVIHEKHNFGEMAWCVLLEQLAVREKEERVFPASSPGGDLIGDIRRLITRIAKRAGLKGSRVDIHAIKRSLADGNHFMNYSADLELARSASPPHSTIKEILNDKAINSTFAPA